MLESAKTYGVSYEEAYAETIIHEMMHVYYGGMNTHGEEIDQGYMNSDVQQNTTNVYVQVFQDVGPTDRWWNNGKLPAPSNQIPGCLIPIAASDQDFHLSIESARSAAYQYPTYDFTWNIRVSI